jgi:hypothetical protein
MKLPRIHRMGALADLIRKVGPYGAIGLLVPGGSLIALCLWAVRHRSWFVAHMRRTFALVAAVAAGLTVPQLTFADSAPTSGSQPSAATVPVEQRDCDALGGEQARALADRLYQQGDYQHAGECYLVAGEANRANLAFLKAAPPAGADTLRKMAEDRDTAKTQFEKVKQAWRRSH